MKTINQRCITFLLCLGLLLTTQSCQKNTLQNQNKATFSNQFFTMQYPKSWKEADEANQLSLTGPEELGYYVNVKVDYNPSVGLPLQDFKNTVEAQNNLPTLPQFKDMGETSLTIQDQAAIQHNILTAIQAQNVLLYLSVRLTYLVKDQLGIVITAEIPQDVLGKYDQTINEIIQSIRLK